MTVTALQALGEIGPTHLNDATVAVIVCAEKFHELCRVVATRHGVVYVAHVRAPRLHAEARRVLRAEAQFAPPAKATITELYTPGRLAALKAAGLVGDRADQLPASCDCGNWRVFHDYVIALADSPPARVKGVPRTTADPRRVRPA